MRPSSTALVCVALTLELVACGESEPVPFGLDRTPSTVHTDEAPAGDRLEGAPLTLASAAWPEETRELDLGGAHISLSAAAARASASLDLDDDGDLDALLATLGDDHIGRVVWVRRNDATFDAPIELAATPALGGSCRVLRARIEAIGSALVAATFETECENTNAPAASATSSIVLDVSGAPRILERFGLRARGPLDGLSFVEIDRDRDGHGDLVVQVRIGEETVSMTWRSVASGLARDPAEPETRIAELADAAREAVRRAPETASAAARNALAVHASLCRETELARFEVGGRPGVECRASAGAGRARAVLAAAAAHAGDVLLALEMLGDLERPDVTVRDVDRRLAQDALSALRPLPAWVARDGPEAASGPERETPRLSSLAFEGEDRVLVRTGEPRTVDLTTGEVVPAPERGERRLLDPSGALELIAIERRCDGTVLVIAPSGGVVDPITGDRRVALVEPRPAPIGAPCPELNEALRRDAHGFFALGWAPQGVLVARGAVITVVPLDVAGRPLGVVAALAEGSVAPAPITTGHATRDVSAFARATPYGILLVTRSPASQVLVQPEGFEHEGSPYDVAVSPSARRVAWIGGSRLHWAEVAPAEVARAEGAR